MLKIRRAIGQSVIIERLYKVTVESLASQRARIYVSSATSALTMRLTIHRGESCEIDIGTEGTVEINLLEVIRGEASLGFVAPLTIKIERPERVQGETHG